MIASFLLGLKKIHHRLRFIPQLVFILFVWRFNSKCYVKTSQRNTVLGDSFYKKLKGLKHPK